MSPQAQGSSSILVYETEAKGYGLGSTTPDVKVLPFSSESLGYNTNIISSETINNTRNRSKPGRGNKSVSGDITTQLNPYMATLFKHLLGNMTTTVSSAKYTHTLKVGDLRPKAGWAANTAYLVNDMVYPTTANRNGHAYICTVAGTSHVSTEPTWPTAEASTVAESGGPTWKEYTIESLVFEKQFLNLSTPQYFRYVGGKINSCRMSFRSEGLIPTIFNILGKSETITTTAYDSSATDYGDVPWDMAEVTLTEGGSSSTIITELDILIETNLDGSVFTIGNSGYRYSLPIGLIKVTGTLKALFESVTLYNKAVNNTESSIKATCTRGAGDGGAGAEYTELFISELTYTPKSPMITGPLGVFTELDFEGYYQNSSEESAFQAIFKNTIAAL